MMLSYNWGHQDVIKRLNTALKSRGYSVWIDIEKMQGSTVETMSAAVEECAVMCYGISQAYKESTNCRMEAQYAHQQEKDMVRGICTLLALYHMLHTTSYSTQLSPVPFVPHCHDSHHGAGAVDDEGWLPCERVVGDAVRSQIVVWVLWGDIGERGCVYGQGGRAVS